MPMKNPLHPGRIVKHECLQPLSLTVKRAAEILGVTRQALNNIVNEKAAISADMAIRLEKAFGGTANVWLQMQSNYDLARARRHEGELKVQRNAPELARPA
jgi:antitoxin HigA-1